MKSYTLIAFFLFGISFLVACNGNATAGELPVEITATQVLPTQTPTPENTATPTITSSPTLTPTATIAIPVLENTPFPRMSEQIGRDNVDQLVAVAQYGTGLLQSMRSYDSKYVSLATSVDVRLIDTMSGTVLWSKPILANKSSFSHDSKLLAINTAQSIEIWDVQTGHTLQVLPLDKKNYCFLYCSSRPLSNDEREITYLRFSDDDRYLFIADSQGFFGAWDIAKLDFVSHSIVGAETLNTKNDLLFIGKPGSASIEVWKIPEFTLLFSVQGPASQYRWAPFTLISSDGTMAYSSNQNTSDPAIIWSTKDGQIIKELGSGDYSWPRFSDSQFLIQRNDGGNYLVERSSWKTTKLPGAQTDSILSFDTDNRLVLGINSGTRTWTRSGRTWQVEAIQIWDYVNEKWEKTREIIFPNPINLYYCSLSEESNPNLFCLSYDTGTGYAWIELASGDLKILEKDNAYLPVSFSPSQELLYAGNAIRNVSDGSLYQKFAECCVGFLYDDSVVQIDMTNAKLELVDIETGEIRFQANTNPKADAYYFSPDGTLLVRKDGEIFTLWNIKESAEIGRFSNPEPKYPFKEYNTVKFSIDGTRIYMNNEKN